jgi:NtrC-family two-component system sensor histidine kinase KinB
MSLDANILNQVLQAREVSEQALSSFHDPIMAMTSDARVYFKNRAAETLKFQDRLPYLLEQLAEPVLKSGRDHIPKTFVNAICLRIDDTEIFFLPFIIAICDEHGVLAGAAVILHDLTKIKRNLPCNLT